jgi:hypothetical protein
MIPAVTAPASLAALLVGWASQLAVLAALVRKHHGARAVSAGV